jgi:hypothetical protein
VYYRNATHATHTYTHIRYRLRIILIKLFTNLPRSADLPFIEKANGKTIGETNNAILTSR